jgi:four helix bundle protein
MCLLSRKLEEEEKFMQVIRKPYSSDPRKLLVYEKSLNFAEDIYGISDEFRDDTIREKIRKSACSVATNIAESRATMSYSKEFNHLNVEIGSISQSRSLLEMALVFSYITFEKFQQADSKAIELLKMSFSLITRLKQHVEIIDVDKWRVEDFRQSHLYNRSIDLMQSIYWLVDSINFNITPEEANKAYQIAINAPLLIASGIGQLNTKVRIKKFNEVNDNYLKKLNMLLSHFQNLSNGQSECLNSVEENSIQVLKLLNSYFGRLKSSNGLEQL